MRYSDWMRWIASLWLALLLSVTSGGAVAAPCPGGIAPVCAAEQQPEPAAAVARRWPREQRPGASAAEPAIRLGFSRCLFQRPPPAGPSTL